jgi:hypothetical protein
MAQRTPNRMSDDELFRDWLVGMERIYSEMISLGQNRRMFKMMRDVADRNARLRETGGHVLDWMFENYALAAAMSFRRDLDRDMSTLGLLNLLYEIADRPTIINRGRYRAKWKPTRDSERWMCEHAFDSFNPTKYPSEPERDHIDPAVVNSDRERLLAETEKVRRFVEQTFAHRARGTPETVTWGEFHSAIDVMVEVFKKYYALLTQASLTGIEPTPQYNTHECLTFPWWEAERRDN